MSRWINLDCFHLPRRRVVLRIDCPDLRDQDKLLGMLIAWGKKDLPGLEVALRDLTTQFGLPAGFNLVAVEFNLRWNRLELYIDHPSFEVTPDGSECLVWHPMSCLDCDGLGHFNDGKPCITCQGTGKNLE